ncbi:hypothetical protein [Rummeliibacillus pycnus]|uniref:hypothetical protein n=1 Tax=Rummeliibacillus pycnus TaxID=101070 RepID=UPI000C9C839F|nr:hypothetical protein [Rummeliibacillus pycnus]
MKHVFRQLFLFLIIIFSSSLIAHAEQTDLKQGEEDGGLVVYHVKYDYNAIFQYLGLSRNQFEQYWKEGFSISDMAEKQGISRREIESYFYEFHYNEMQKWRAKGVLSEKHYYHCVYMLADEIEEFIDRNPNRIE